MKTEAMVTAGGEASELLLLVQLLLDGKCTDAFEMKYRDSDLELKKYPLLTLLYEGLKLVQPTMTSMSSPSFTSSMLDDQSIEGTFRIATFGKFLVAIEKSFSEDLLFELDDQGLRSLNEAVDSSWLLFLKVCWMLISLFAKRVLFIHKRQTYVFASYFRFSTVHQRYLLQALQRSIRLPFSTGRY